MKYKQHGTFLKEEKKVLCNYCRRNVYFSLVVIMYDLQRMLIPVIKTLSENISMCYTFKWYKDKLYTALDIDMISDSLLFIVFTACILYMLWYVCHVYMYFRYTYVDFRCGKSMHCSAAWSFHCNICSIVFRGKTYQAIKRVMSLLDL